MLQQGKQTITIENLTGGWAYDLSGSNSAAVKGSEDQYSKSSQIALFRPGQEGNIAPGLVFSTVSDAQSRVNGLALAGDVDSSGNAFCLLQGSGTCGIVWFDVTNPAIGSNFHGIAGTATVSATNGDILNYYQQTGTTTIAVEEYVYFSYENGTVGDVGRRTKSSTSFNDNYLTGLATQNNGNGLFLGVPHPLIFGKNEVLYIGNGRYLASHDPTTTSVDYKAFDLKPGFIIADTDLYQNYIAILGYRGNTNTAGTTKGECKLFLWDGFSPTWNFEYPLRDFKASALLNDGDNLYAFTSGRNNTTKKWKFNGSGFDDPIVESAQIGNPPSRGGIDLYYNNIVWGESGGRVLAYNQGLHYISALQSVGMVKTFYQNTLFVGNNNGGTYTIQYSTPSAGYALSANLRSRLIELPTNSTITCVKVYFSQFGTGASVTVSGFKDYNTTAVGGASDFLNKTISFANEEEITYYPIKKTVKNVNSFYLFLTFNHASTSDTAAIIRKIEVEVQVDTNNI